MIQKMENMLFRITYLKAIQLYHFIAVYNF